MVFQKALYWIAVALMVPLLVNHFANRYDRWVPASHQASVLAMAQRALGRSHSFAWFGIAPWDTRSAFLQAQIARQQAACARLEAEHAQMMAMRQLESLRVRTICPRRGVRITPPEQAVPRQGTI